MWPIFGFNMSMPWPCKPEILLPTVYRPQSTPPNASNMLLVFFCSSHSPCNLCPTPMQHAHALSHTVYLCTPRPPTHCLSQHSPPGRGNTSLIYQATAAQRRVQGRLTPGSLLLPPFRFDELYSTLWLFRYIIILIRIRVCNGQDRPVVQVGSSKL